MKKLDEWIQWRTISGQSLAVGDVTVTPQTQALIIRWPLGGFVWNRPTAVLVERQERLERIPVVDATRGAQLAVIGLSLVFSLMIATRSIRHRRNQDER